ncbi:carbamoyl phosphate synthase small subunit [Companilactobacillus alimentarius]|uniref:Carbamoyl phosphate synthase small chain n=1 Tax=Companilactobacillus alimentarius DSM 20249 TaxID=1423720 RepID=A0A2K9HMH8_9LACO|nr:carbamoyl phosphate synthase small subunit [Companilactobacillus alimentarius]AUI72375.1 carbamoyl phosphate synthase small subunit [Companilactobacillus alimentarius DSM 20249]KRK76601.1 carbamoyl phosphate synthase small subunit [Companilactobacillus alimentarius DSM 20249]GEO45762.1 carbamoyl-phosphate synthase small chain [Companilactobacillus alimentarius]
MKRYLVFEDGTYFEGKAFGSNIETIGELVFTTGMSGYQEAITDQSYNGQIINFCTPMIGNYGIAKKFNESPKSFIKGVLAREIADTVGNYQSEMTIDQFLKEENIPGIYDIDTRAITLKIRKAGTLKAAIVDDLNSGLMDQIENWKLDKAQLNQNIIKKPQTFAGSGKHVVMLDYGYKQSIVDELQKRDVKVTVVPGNTSVTEIENLLPDGILLSNGPGDPLDHTDILPNIVELEKKYPVFGICMGHQLLCLANGAKTFKMKFGHRGFNHPVKNLETGKIYFTSQNHGYAVDPESIAQTELKVTQVELNDQTVEGVEHTRYDAFSVQFHPDAMPGPHDADFIFDKFLERLNK